MARPPFNRPDLPTDYRPRLKEWGELWGVREIEPEIKVEISSRMTRSLGRCYADRKLIRIARFVAEESGELFEEVLCHEAAHVAAYHLHGRSIRPHGREWRALVQTAGYEPSVKYKGEHFAVRVTRVRRKSPLGTVLNRLQAALANGMRSPAFKRRKP